MTISRQGFPKLRISHLSQCENLRNAKIQNFAFFVDIRIIAKFREIVYIRINLHMFCIAKDAKFRFAWKPYSRPMNRTCTS